MRVRPKPGMGNMGSPAGGKASVAASSGTRPRRTLLAPNRDAEGLARRIGIQADHPHEREKRASLLAGEFNRHSGCQGFAPEPKAPAPNPYCLPPPVLHRHPSKSAIQVAGVGPDAPTTIAARPFCRSALSSRTSAETAIWRRVQLDGLPLACSTVVVDPVVVDAEAALFGGEAHRRRRRQPMRLPRQR